MAEMASPSNPSDYGEPGTSSNDSEEESSPSPSRNPNPPPKFLNKEEFYEAMESGVKNAINESISVLHRDPREYHPFYLRVYKFTTIGRQLGFLQSEEEVDALWRKYDNFATTQFEKWEESGGIREDFNCEHSPYLKYIQTKKVVLNGQLIYVKRNEKERDKCFSEIDGIVRKYRRDWAAEGITDEEIRSNLRLRLRFFQDVKNVTFPGDVGKANKLWNALLVGFTKGEWKDVQERLAKKYEGNPVEVKRSGRERKPPRRFQAEISGKTGSNEEPEPSTSKAVKKEGVPKSKEAKTEDMSDIFDQRQWKSPVGKAAEGGECPYCKKVLKNQLARHVREVHFKLKPLKRKGSLEGDEVNKEEVPVKPKKKRKDYHVGDDERGTLPLKVNSIDAGNCPHCHRFLQAKLTLHIARFHIITPEGQVFNRRTQAELAKLTPEERKKYNREWQRLRRENRTEEEKEEESKRFREKRTQKLSSMTPEELEEYKRRRRFEAFQKRVERENMPEEEKIRRSTLRFVRNQAWLSQKDKSWWEEQLEKRKRYAREKRARMSAEEKEEVRRRQKEYVKKLSGEKLERHKANVRKAIKKYMERLKTENPEEYYNKQKTSLAKFLEYQRNRTQNETPEKREARLLRYRINQAKRRAREELQGEGASPQEIERRLREVEETVRSQPRPSGGSEYKPRLGARKPHRKIGPRSPQKTRTNTTTGGGPPHAQVPATHPLLKQASSSELLSESQDQQISTSLQPPQPIYPPFQIAVFDSTPTLSLVQCVGVPAPATSTITVISSSHSTSPPPVDNFDDNSPPSPICDGFQEEDPPPASTDYIPIFQNVPNVLVSGNEQMTSNIQILTNSLQSTPQPPLEFQLAFTVVDTVPPASEPVTVLAPQAQVYTPFEELMNEQAVDQSGILNYVENQLPPCPPSRQPAMCDECGKTFTTQASVELHKNVLHAVDPSVLICPKCQHRCSSTISLWNHFATHHIEDVDAFPDDIFPKKRKTPWTTGQPRNPNEPYKQIRSDPNNPHSCTICGKSFVQKCTLDDHIRRVHEGKGHYCDVCGRDQQSAAKLWRHKVERHGMQDLPPPVGVPAVKCKYCSEIIMRGYEQHVKKRHPESVEDLALWYTPETGTAPRKTLGEQVKCPHCPSMVKQKLLNRHIKHVHNTGQKYPCPECRFPFKRMDHMKKHYRDHHAIADIEKKLAAKQFIRFTKTARNFSATCLLCDEEFGSKVVLRAHFVREHHEIFQECQVASLPIFQCTICEDRYSSETQLKNHMEGAHSDKLFTCQHCGIFKYSQSELTSHERTHKHKELSRMRKTGKCSICEYEATPPKVEGLGEKGGAKAKEVLLEGFLREHVKQDHPEKFFPCPNPNCMKFCLNPEGLQNHLIRCQKLGSLNSKEFVRKEVDVLLVKCSECENFYKFKHLDRHLKVTHGKTEKVEYPCEKCAPRKFRCRRYFVAHMHLAHGVPFNELVELAPTDTPGIVSRIRGDGGDTEESSGTEVETPKRKRKIGPKSRTQERAGTSSTSGGGSEEKKRRGRSKGGGKEKKEDEVAGAQVETKKLAIRVERLSDDLLNFYLARRVIVKEEPEY